MKEQSGCRSRRDGVKGRRGSGRAEERWEAGRGQGGVGGSGGGGGGGVRGGKLSDCRKEDLVEGT